MKKLLKYQIPLLFTLILILFIGQGSLSAKTETTPLRIQYLSKLTPYFPTKLAPMMTEDLQKKKIIIHYWATWCAPCKEEIPKIVTFLKEGSQNFDAFYFVSLDDDERAHRLFWEQIFNKKGIQFSSPNIAILQDKSGLSKSMLDIVKVPETHIIKNGEVKRRIIGNNDWSSSIFLSFLKSI